jgi:hypothetical protein
MFAGECSILNRSKTWRMISLSVLPAKSMPAKEPTTPKTSSSAASSAFIPEPVEWRIVPSMSQRIRSFFTAPPASAAG